MPKWLDRLTGGRRGVPEAKAVGVNSNVLALAPLGQANWTGRGFAALVGEGFAKNPVVYRCVRMVAEAANRVPLIITEKGERLERHPLLDLLSRPNRRQSGSELLEAVYAYLQTSGNAYLKAGIVDGEVTSLWCLRPDRMQVVPGADGWPGAYRYTVGGRATSFDQTAQPVAEVLHMALFDPLDDHYGMSPLEAAAQSLDIHNAAARWNKALLDNAARPSGALVYSAEGSNLTDEQFRRLKDELVDGFAGAANAGRPMVLEGGLDWKSIALTPRDMDFVEAKNGAARDIALAFGVPPMLLGIPGDNTYANLAEANKALWRNTVIPLTRRVADDIAYWLSPAFGGALQLEPDIDAIEALAEDRAALWGRIGGATFLDDAEKRRLLRLE